MSAPLKIAVAGLGTVGTGLLKLLAANGELLAKRCGRPLVVTAVSARDQSRDRGVSLDGLAWFDDPSEMAARADADVVVEVSANAPEPVAEALHYVAVGGRIILAGVKGFKPVPDFISDLAVLKLDGTTGAETWRTQFPSDLHFGTGWPSIRPRIPSSPERRDRATSSWW